MSATEYLLIGGGLASGEAAKTIRERDPKGRVLMVSAERHLPYDRPPLTKEYMRGEKPQAELFFDPPELYKGKEIETLLGVRAQSLDLARNEAALSNGDRVTFEKVLLATGGTPVRLEVPGGNLTGIHYLRTIEDCEGIQADATKGRRAVIIGAGFIGMEAAASLTKRGVQVTVIGSAPKVWSRFVSPEIASYIQLYCEQNGVAFVLGERVTGIKGTSRAEAVVLASGREVPCDFVCAAIGIRPNVELAQAAGLTVEDGVVVDTHLRTPNANVYAAGDIANYPDPIFGRRRRVEHWGQAEYMGQIAGANMAGEETPYDLVTYVWSELFDLHLEFGGDESKHDRVVVRGRFGDDGATAFYLLEGHMVAYFALNADKRDFPLYKRVIREKRDLSKAITLLEDLKSDLRAVLGNQGK